MMKVIEMPMGYNEENKKRQREWYARRVGTIYGDFEVIKVEYDEQARKQIWTLRCTKCGSIRITRNGHDYQKGRNTGICGNCRRIAQKNRKKEKDVARKTIEYERGNDARWFGKEINGWEVLGYESGKGWKVRCLSCGSETFHRRKEVESGIKCMCKMPRYDDADFIGVKYGHLTPIERRGGYFLCQCDCGNKKLVKTTFLANGTAVSCGTKCKYHPTTKPIHGLAGTRIYKTWHGMVDRCYNPKNNSFIYYGARGISVCDEWRNDVKAFYDWAMLSGYKSHLTIDRINNDGNYEPSNCRWATYKQQNANKRPAGTVKPLRGMVEFNGEKIALHKLCDRYNINVGTVLYRMRVKKMPLSDALAAEKYSVRSIPNS